MKRTRFVTIRKGVSAPYRARVFTLGDDGPEAEPRFETDLASPDDVRGFLKAVHPDAHVDEVRWGVDGIPNIIFVVAPAVESLGALTARAIQELESNTGTTYLRLAPAERRDFDASIANWKKTPAPLQHPPSIPAKE